MTLPACGVRLCVLVALAFATPASASEALRPSLAKVAAAVAKIMRTRGDESIVVGSFVGPINFGSSAGPGIQKILTDELESQGLQVKRFGAALGMRGEYFYTTAEGQPDAPRQIRLKVVLTDGSGQTLTSLNQQVEVEELDANEAGGAAADVTPVTVKKVVSVRDGEFDFDTLTGGEEAAALLGVTWDFERSGLGLGVDKDIVEQSFQSPTAQIVGGTAVRSSPNSPYFLEVFVGNRPLPLRLEDGQPMVTLQRGQSFAVRVTNRARHDVSATLTLDGVNSFAFSQERQSDGKRLVRYVIEGDKWAMIRGWHETFTTTAAFKMADLGSSAVARIGASTSSLGMITVVIRSSWMEGSQMPNDEPRPALVEAAPAAPGESILAGNPADPSGDLLPVSRAPANVHPTEPGAVRGVNEPGRADAPSPSSPAIGFGQTMTHRSHVATGRATGVVRSIITLRYDR